MKIKRVNFVNYKNLKRKSFEFNSGVNEIKERNEFGKSTIIEGINDVFSLNAGFSNKITKGESVFPVVEIIFELDGVEYVLKANTQTGKITLTGDNGTDLEGKDKIKDFFKHKGLEFFQVVVPVLLTIKERDLAPNLALDKVKELLDSVLSAKRIEDLKMRTSEIVGSRGLVGTYRKKWNSLSDKLEEMAEELKELEEEFKNYDRDSRELSNLGKELEKSKKEFDYLKKERESFESLVKIKEFEEINRELKKNENELELAKKREKELSEKIKDLSKRIKNRETEKDKSLKVNYDIQGKLRLIEKDEKDLLTLRQEMGELKKISTEIQKLEKELGDFVSLSPEDLRGKKSDWDTYNKLKKAKRGVIKVIESGGEVVIDERRYAKGDRAEFAGESEILYRDLTLKLFTTTDLEKYEEKVKKLKEAFGSIENLSNVIKKLTEIRDKKASLQSRAPEELEKKIKELEKRISEKKKIAEKLKEIETQLSNIEIDLGKLKKEERDAEDQLATIKSRIGGLSAEIKNDKERIEKISDIERAKKSVLYAVVEDHKNEDSEAIKEKLEEIRIKNEEVAERLKEMEIKESALKERVARRLDEKKLDVIREHKKELERKLTSLKRLEEVARYTQDALEVLSKKINKRFLENFKKDVSSIFSMITQGEYEEVEFESSTIIIGKDEFEGSWTATRKDGKIFPIEDLSDGTKSQLLLSARLALIKRLLGNKTAFILMDEPFAYFDNEREKRTREVISILAGEGWQVLLMTAKGE